MSRIITHVNCSEVGFIVSLISRMFQVELTHESASSDLHRDMAIPLGLLLSTWSAFVMNRWEFASAVFAWSLFLLKNWNNLSLFALLSIFRRFCHFAPLIWGILDEISVCHPAVRGSATWDFPPYMYRKLYPLFCRLESTDSQWVVAGVSRLSH